jgi:hypothetical protein
MARPMRIGAGARCVLVAALLLGNVLLIAHGRDARYIRYQRFISACR